MASSVISSPENSPPGTPSRADSALPVLNFRSEVKAMLAGLNSDSEDDDVEEDISVLMKKASKPPEGIETTKKKQQEEISLSGDSGSESLLLSDAQSDNDDDEPVRPRGKLASRMMVATNSTKAKKPETAYERVKESIFGGDNSTLQSEGDYGSDAEMEDGDDEDEDVPIPTLRRKKTPTKKVASPKPSSASSTPKSKSRSASPPADSDSDNELPEDILGNHRFQALVAKKRAEREAAQAAELEKRKAREKLAAELGGGSSDEGDSGSGGVLSQRAPTRRKAGKKALEEMHKETQRMARSMQLAHQATTRKKITKQSLFDKFNFRPSKEPAAKEEAVVDSSSVVASAESDQQMVSTPNTSPESAPKSVEDTPMDMDMDEPMDINNDTTPKPDKGKAVLRVIDDDTAPRALDKGKDKEVSIDKGKGKAPEFKSPKGKSPKTKLTLPPVRVILPHLPSRPSRPADSDSDSDLEIVAPSATVTTSPNAAAHFERQKMIQELRRARRASPPRMRKAGQLTAKELQAELLRKGRAQAALEREEQIRELKAKGIIVLTAEERAKENKEIEDLLEKARQEALAVKRIEKRQEKKEKGIMKEGCEDDDDEEDEDWLEEEEEGCIIELSGSEDEEGGKGEGEGEDGDGGEGADVNDFSDEEKEKKDEDLEDGITTPVFSLSSMRPRETPRLSEIPAAYIDDEASDDSDSGEFAPLKKKSQLKKQQRKKLRVVSDDEDGMETEQEKKPESKIPSIFRRSAEKPMFMGIGMTQLFASTLGDLPPGEVQVEASQDIKGKVDTLRRDPGEGFPGSQTLGFSEDSQNRSQPEGGKLNLEYSQSQIWQPEPESLPKVMLQYDSDAGEEMPDPTQDQGFAMSSNPAPPRFTPTQEEPTGSISSQILDSQLGIIKKRKGRLMRRETDFSDEEDEGKQSDSDRVEESAAEEEDVADIAENVFDLMKKASKKSKPKKEPDNFDKSKSEAKGMVHEQAEESEDEYAGIGGASDDEADNGHDSEMEDMVDDTNKEEIDENAMAAYNAEREMAQDQKDVNKLLKDLQSGLLRKKRGAEFDLDDSDEDDDGEARRRAKRRQMEKMRRELLKDGNIEKIANNPKRLAFLRAIEDNDRDEEMDFLDKGEEDLFLELGMVSQSEVSQSQQENQSASETASPALGSREASEEGSRRGSKETTPLPVPQSRRPVKTKISTLAHVREQLSFLVEEKDSQIELSDDSETESVAVVQRQRRTTAVIDRVAIARSTSSISESTKMAFQTSVSSAQFKVPTLLRRATTSSTLSTGSDSQSSTGTERSLGQADTAGVKRGGKASSSINFHAREQIRSKIANEREVKKKMERKKEGQKRQSVLGMLAKGGFS